MTRKLAIGSRGQKYYHYGTYQDLKTAQRTAWYYKKTSHSKWKIDEINIGDQKRYRLWLTNIVRY